jgi:hypothetical protein
MPTLVDVKVFPVWIPDTIEFNSVYSWIELDSSLSDRNIIISKVYTTYVFGA